eukprot:7627663-Lingulodinium_polyedra.AAC.1
MIAPPLLARMWDVGLVALLQQERVAHHDGRVVAAELFGVVKKATDALRVIVGRRPRAALEIGLRVALLMVGEAHPSLKPQVAEDLR